eukprot:gnl/MRDRNA2_/MRDRNA2_108979_c0_seq1.p1 gnl/MRDRNA2_/MRDRNA2_108979_c0~~gnl/MRDRNA2_/MRDRNA2_108979_c0_seq1.p1  ORF type:complete len:676 (-),score=143.06 gnl/MRDRNA2_/MRDRNA2_108979_c0_seq1:222-2249(-)
MVAQTSWLLFVLISSSTNVLSLAKRMATLGSEEDMEDDISLNLTSQQVAQGAPCSKKNIQEYDALVERMKKDFGAKVIAEGGGCSLSCESADESCVLCPWRKVCLRQEDGKCPAGCEEHKKASALGRFADSVANTFKQHCEPCVYQDDYMLQLENIPKFLTTVLATLEVTLAEIDPRKKKTCSWMSGCSKRQRRVTKLISFISSASAKALDAAQNGNVADCIAMLPTSLGKQLRIVYQTFLEQVKYQLEKSKSEEYKKKLPPQAWDIFIKSSGAYGEDNFCSDAWERAQVLKDVDALKAVEVMLKQREEDGDEPLSPAERESLNLLSKMKASEKTEPTVTHGAIRRKPTLEGGADVIARELDQVSLDETHAGLDDASLVEQALVEQAEGRNFSTSSTALASKGFFSGLLKGFYALFMHATVGLVWGAITTPFIFLNLFAEWAEADERRGNMVPDYGGFFMVVIFGPLMAALHGIGNTLTDTDWYVYGRDDENMMFFGPNHIQQPREGEDRFSAIAPITTFFHKIGATWRQAKIEFKSPSFFSMGLPPGWTTDLDSHGHIRYLNQHTCSRLTWEDLPCDGQCGAKGMDIDPNEKRKCADGEFQRYRDFQAEHEGDESMVQTFYYKYNQKKDRYSRATKKECENKHCQEDLVGTKKLWKKWKQCELEKVECSRYFYY